MKEHLCSLARDPLAHLFLPSSPSHFQTFREEGLLKFCKVEHHKAKKAQFCSCLCKATICPLMSQRKKRNFYLWLQKTWKKWRMWISPDASDLVLGKGKQKEVIKSIVSSAFSSHLNHNSVLVLHHAIKDHVVAHCASKWEGGQQARTDGIWAWCAWNSCYSFWVLKLLSKIGVGERTKHMREGMKGLGKPKQKSWWGLKIGWDAM